jgi:hypothetical protein
MRPDTLETHSDQPDEREVVVPLRPEHAEPWLRSARSATSRRTACYGAEAIPPIDARPSPSSRRRIAGCTPKCCRQLESLSYRIGSVPLESLNQLLAAIDVLAAEVTDPER